MISKIFFGFDVRKKGSGNMGSTNVYRVLGVKWGIIVQLLDISKGLLPTLIIAPLIVFPEFSLNLTQAKIIMGLSAVLGHIFSPFVSFKGGKGINTALGMMIGVSYIDLSIGLLFFLFALFSTGMVSAGALAAAFILPNALAIRHFLFHPVQDFRSLLILFIILTVTVFYTHRTNIRRILNGNENRFSRLHIFHFRK